MPDKNEFVSAFTWIPGDIKVAMEFMAQAFLCHQQKPCVGFHVIKEGETEFRISLFEYPPSKELRGFYGIAFHEIINLFDHNESFSSYSLVHEPMISFNGTIFDYDVSVEVYLKGFQSSDGLPPLLYDLASEQWTERELLAAMRENGKPVVNVLEKGHGDYTSSFVYWFMQHKSPLARLLNDLLEKRCCRDVLHEDEYEEFREHLELHEISSEKLRMVDEAGREWKRTLSERDNPE